MAESMSSPNRPAITRHRTRKALVGGIPIGGGSPIVVQSMTNTDTADVSATVLQVKALADAGSELVRIAVNTAEAAAAVAEIRQRLDALGCHVPLIGGTEHGQMDQLVHRRALPDHRVGKAA